MGALKSRNRKFDFQHQFQILVMCFQIGLTKQIAWSTRESQKLDLKGVGTPHAPKTKISILSADSSL